MLIVVLISILLSYLQESYTNDSVLSIISGTNHKQEVQPYSNPLSKEYIEALYWPKDTNTTLLTPGSLRKRLTHPASMSRDENLGLLAIYVGYGTSRFDKGEFVKGVNLEDTIRILNEKRAIERRSFYKKLTIISISSILFLTCVVVGYLEWKKSQKRKRKYVSTSTFDY